MECLHRTKEVSPAGEVGYVLDFEADHFLLHQSITHQLTLSISQTPSSQTLIPRRYLTSLFQYDANVHFTRQIARAKEIKTHFLQKQAHESKDARKAAERGATGAIVSLGLVEEEGSGGGGK